MEISLSCTPSPLDHQFESEIPQLPNQLRNICISVDIKITWSFTRSLWLNNSQNFTADASAIRDFSLPKCSSGWDQPLGCCAGKLARIRGLYYVWNFLSIPWFSFAVWSSLLKKVTEITVQLKNYNTQYSCDILT